MQACAVPVNGIAQQPAQPQLISQRRNQQPQQPAHKTYQNAQNRPNQKKQADQDCGEKAENQREEFFQCFDDEHPLPMRNQRPLLLRVLRGRRSLLFPEQL